MADEADRPKSLGQAIDGVIDALKSLDDASRLTVIKAACDHLKIAMPKLSDADGLGNVERQAHIKDRISDITTFRQEKQPASGNEMAAVTAYFLSELAPADEQKKEVRTEDMEKYFKQAGYPLPQQPAMLLQNAKNAGYFDSASRGGYKLNAVGYNLVAHNLPRGSTASPVPARRRAKRKTGPKAKRKGRAR